MADTKKDELEETKRIMQRLVKTPPKPHKPLKGAGKNKKVPPGARPTSKAR